MKIIVEGKIAVDTDNDLSAAERHILQKLFGWKDLVGTAEEFREKTRQCLAKGWDSSGPVAPGKHLALVIEKMEKEFDLHIKNKRQS